MYCIEFEEFEVKPTIFPYNQLRIATRDFHPDMKLGQGSFGAVYKVIFFKDILIKLCNKTLAEEL